MATNVFNMYEFFKRIQLDENGFVLLDLSGAAIGNPAISAKEFYAKIKVDEVTGALSVVTLL